MGLFLHRRDKAGIIHQKTGGAPECFEEESPMLVGGCWDGKCLASVLRMPV